MARPRAPSTCSITGICAVSAGGASSLPSAPAPCALYDGTAPTPNAGRPAASIPRPKWLPEAPAAGLAAVAVMACGALPWQQARAEAGRLLPVLAFLGAILVVGHVCQEEGLFAAAGARLARASRGSPVRVL